MACCLPIDAALQADVSDAVPQRYHDALLWRHTGARIRNGSVSSCRQLGVFLCLVACVGSWRSGWRRDAAAAKAKPHHKLRAAIERTEGSGSAARPTQYKRPALRQYHSLCAHLPLASSLVLINIKRSSEGSRDHAWLRMQAIQSLTRASTFSFDGHHCPVLLLLHMRLLDGLLLHPGERVGPF